MTTSLQHQNRVLDLQQYPVTCRTAQMFADAVSARCDYQSPDVQDAIDQLVVGLACNPDAVRFVYLAAIAKLPRSDFVEHLLYFPKAVAVATGRTRDQWLAILAKEAA